MQNNTDRKKAKLGAILCGVGIALLLTVLLVVYLSLMAQTMEIWAVTAVLGLYALLIAVVILCVVISLRQRLKEIDSDEYEQYKQY